MDSKNKQRKYNQDYYQRNKENVHKVNREWMAKNPDAWKKKFIVTQAGDNKESTLMLLSRFLGTITVSVMFAAQMRLVVTVGV